MVLLASDVWQEKFSAEGNKAKHSTPVTLYGVEPQPLINGWDGPYDGEISVRSQGEDSFELSIPHGTKQILELLECARDATTRVTMIGGTTRRDIWGKVQRRRG